MYNAQHVIKVLKKTMCLTIQPGENATNVSCRCLEIQQGHIKRHIKAKALVSIVMHALAAKDTNLAGQTVIDAQKTIVTKKGNAKENEKMRNKRFLRNTAPSTMNTKLKCLDLLLMAKIDIKSTHKFC